jgi:hypothetical protein
MEAGTPTDGPQVCNASTITLHACDASSALSSPSARLESNYESPSLFDRAIAILQCSRSRCGHLDAVAAGLPAHRLR